MSDRTLQSNSKQTDSARKPRTAGQAVPAHTVPNLQDGEVRYKTSIAPGGAELNHALIRSAVYPNVLMMDAYLPGIMTVLYGDVSPAEAIAQVEG
jgi:hypothetical protein